MKSVDEGQLSGGGVILEGFVSGYAVGDRGGGLMRGGSTVIGGRVTCICVMISLTLLRYIAVCATSRCAR